MVLMRTPVLDGTETLATGIAECARLHNEKALDHGEHGGQLKTLAEGRSRTRKGKSVQKKQPQRGLGVAQLEKLRLQEQSKQKAACLPSMQSLASVGFSVQNQNDGTCFRHINGASSHHHNYGHSSSLPFGNDRLGSPDKLGDYLARGVHRHIGKGSVDEDLFRTLLSLSSRDHISLAGHGGGPSVSIMLPRCKDDCDRSFVFHNPRAETLGNKVHGSPSNVNNPGTEASPARRASCALACDASPPNSVRKSSFFSSALVSRASPADSHPSSLEIGDEKPVSAEAVNTPKESVPRTFSSGSNNGVMEVGVINAELLPVVMNASTGAPIFTLTNLQCFKSSLRPANLGRLPQDRTNVPVVVGVAANCDRPKELSSFQSFSSNQSWSTPETSCGWKRPWQALHESTCKLLHSESLDLNALAGEIDAPNRDRDSVGVAQGQQIADGSHHSEDIIRSASEACSPRPVKIRVRGLWDENRSSGVAVRDMGLYSDESLPKGFCAPESKRKIRRSSDFPPSSLTLNRRRCLSNPEIPLLTRSDHQKSRDFLTLGLSSFPVSPQPEVEVDNQEAVIPEERCETKQADIRSKETHDILQLQMCNPQQVEQMESHSPFLSNEFVCSDGLRAHVRPSFGFFPLSSASVTEHCPRQTGRKKQDFLDLRLKLAL